LADVRFRKEADVRLKARLGLSDCARNGFPNGRDEKAKTASKQFSVSAGTKHRRSQPGNSTGVRRLRDDIRDLGDLVALGGFAAPVAKFLIITKVHLVPQPSKLQNESTGGSQVLAIIFQIKSRGMWRHRQKFAGLSHTGFLGAETEAEDFGFPVECAS